MKRDRRCKQAQTLQYAQTFLQGLGGGFFDLPCVVSAAIQLGSHEFLANLGLWRKPEEYNDATEFMRDYAAVSLLSKYDNLQTGIDTKAVALASFASSEEKCRETNARLGSFNRTVFAFSDRLPRYICTAVEKIRRCLGDFSWDHAFDRSYFSSGATLELPKRRGKAWYKYGLASPTVTGPCAVLAQTLFRMSSQWQSVASREGSCPEFSIVQGNRLATVPKNAKTDRVIAVEPCLNMLFQKGIGSVIRQRLKRVGIDLDSQERNQELAKAGSIDGRLATLDLRSASDTIASGLVEMLIPEDWLLAMKLTRSERAIGASLYQKFSSMGNGFTFELESLIFWALSESVVETCGGSGRDVCVYGDDIIVPAAYASELVRLLDYVGFTTNDEKSFITGPFRESCGKHYFRGIDVTPIYIRKDIACLERKLWWANSITRFSIRKLGLGWGRCSSMLPAYRFVVRDLPQRYQLPSIGLNNGDGALVGTFDEVTPIRAPHGHEGFVVKHRVPIPVLKRVGGMASLIQTLREGCSSHLTQELISDFITSKRLKQPAVLSIKDGVELTWVETGEFKWRTVKSVIPLWEDCGPWVEG